MIRLLSDVGGPDNVTTLVYGAIATAVSCGGVVGLVVCWLTAAVSGGSE